MLVHQRVSQFCWIIRQLLLGTLGTQLSFANDVRVVMPYITNTDYFREVKSADLSKLKMAWRNQLNPRIRTFCSLVPMLSLVFVQCFFLHRHEEINCNICKSISRWLPLNTAHGNILPEICFFLGRELYHQASWQWSESGFSMAMLYGLPEGELWSRSGNHIKHTVESISWLVVGQVSMFFCSLDQVFHGGHGRVEFQDTSRAEPQVAEFPGDESTQTTVPRAYPSPQTMGFCC